MSRYNGLRSFIASHRDASVLSVAARLCRIYLDLYDNARHWNFETNGEQLICQSILSRTRGPVFDVGAHHGDYSAILAELDPRRSIFAFEPVPAHIAIAQKRLERYPNVRIIPKGLSDSESSELVHLSSKHPQTASTVAFTHDFDTASKVTDLQCEFTTGDAFCLNYNVNELSFLKIDVEGMEERVLRGFVKMLREGRVQAIQFEHGPTHAVTGHTVRTLHDAMSGYGFQTWVIFPNGLRSIGTIGVDHESFRGRNFLSVHSAHADLYRDLLVGSC
jgi:FkbM family methyltransferase